MIRVAWAFALALGILVGWHVPSPAQAVLCFFERDRVSGMHRICYYDCLGDTVAITIPSHRFCPLSINR